MLKPDNDAVRLSAAGATDAGPRPTNQDCHFLDVELGLFVVADGMGGHNAGEVASQMAVDAVVEFVRATGSGSEITWPVPLNAAQSMAANRVEAAMRIANHRVHESGERDPGRAGMGTTIVVLLVDGARIIVGHVGDSRAYLWRAGELRQVTQDHTWLNAIDDGASEALENHPLRHVLTNGIGMGEDLTPSVIEMSVAAGDRWLLCTDGVHGSLDARRLGDVMAMGGAEQASRHAVRQALAAGTTDNATALVLNVE